MKPYGMGVAKLADTLSISMEESEDLFSKYAKAFPKLNNWLKSQSAKAKRLGYSETFPPCNRKRFYPEMSKVLELRKEARNYQFGSEKSKELWKEIYRIEGQTERNGGNQPIQGTGADVTKEALIAVRNLILEYNKKYDEEVAFLICTVHDAIDAEVRDDIAEEFATQMSELMIDCGNKYVSKVKMGVDTTITKYWVK